MKVKVSVIMPVYNTNEYVGAAIKSILDQDFKDFELIIVDDFSSDNSYNICKNYADNDSRIKLYKNEKNMGISFTRNKLIKLSNANYIASQDSDDISLSDRLKVEYTFLDKNHDYGVVSGNNIIFNEEGSIIGQRIYGNDIKKNILKKNPISQPSSMFRKDIFNEVGGYDKNLNYGEDYDLWLKIFSKGYKLKNLNQNLLKYRIRSGQTKNQKLRETIKNTIFIQKRAAVVYGIIPTLFDKFYWLLESFLLYVPKSIVLFLFKKLKY